MSGCDAPSNEREAPTHRVRDQQVGNDGSALVDLEALPEPLDPVPSATIVNQAASAGHESHSNDLANNNLRVDSMFDDCATPITNNLSETAPMRMDGDHRDLVGIFPLPNVELNHIPTDDFAQLLPVSGESDRINLATSGPVSESSGLKRHSSPHANDPEDEPGLVPEWQPPRQEGSSRCIDQQWPALRNAALSFLSDHAKLAPIRQEVLLLQDQLIYEGDAGQHKRRFFDDSRRQFIELASRNASSQPESIVEISQLHDQLANDSDELDAHAKKQQSLHQNLNQRVFLMNERETRLVDSAKGFLQVLVSAGLLSQTEIEAASDSQVVSRPSLSHGASSMKLHPLLAAYYDKAGDLQIMRDRLADLETEHLEARTDRMFRQDHEQLLDVSDGVFEMECYNAQSEATRVFENAFHAYQLAREDCLLAGIDPDTDDPRPSDNGMSNPCTPADLDYPSNPDPASPIAIHSSAQVMLHAPATLAGLATSVSNLTGPVPRDTFYGSASRSKGAKAAARVNERVEDWMDASYEPWMEVNLEVVLKERPSFLLQGPRRSTPDLKRARDVDTTEIQKLAPPPPLHHPHSEEVRRSTQPSDYDYSDLEFRNRSKSLSHLDGPTASVPTLDQLRSWRNNSRDPRMDQPP